MLIKQAKSAILMFLVLTILTGLLYPLFITGIAQLFFPWRANGSLLILNNHVIGSELIGQNFSDPKYFWGRPSATTFSPYNAENSSGSNLGPTNPLLINNIKNRIRELQQVDPQNKQLFPVDLVTTSGSGLDPEISPEAAFYQISRIAKIRNISADQIKLLIQDQIKYPTFWLLGESRINVLKLNLALDKLGSTANGQATIKP